MESFFRLESFYFSPQPAYQLCFIYGYGLINVYGMMTHEQNWGLYSADKPLLGPNVLLLRTDTQSSLAFTIFLPKIAFCLDYPYSWLSPFPFLASFQEPQSTLIFLKLGSVVYYVWPSWD